MTVIHRIMTNNLAINAVNTWNYTIMQFPHFDTFVVAQGPILRPFSCALVWKALVERAANHPKAPDNPISTIELCLIKYIGVDKSSTLEPWVRCR